MSENWFHCQVSAETVARDPRWVQRRIAEGRLVRRLPNGGLILRFKGNELQPIGVPS